MSLTGPLADQEVRHLAIDLMTVPTERDVQETIGASNLSTGCQFCLASNLMGDMRETPQTDRFWGGRVVGTAIHSLMERRMKQAQAEFAEQKRTKLAAIAERYPDAIVEQRLVLGEYPGYGEVGTTPDLVLPSRRHLIDWKGTEDKKTSLMRDFTGQTNYGRLAKYVAVYGSKVPGMFRKAIEGLSEKVYAEEMRKKEYRVSEYYRQTQLYMRALGQIGIPIERSSLVFISRNNSMMYDNPGLEGYDDPAKMHGIWVLSFNYDPTFAQATWDRGLAIWQRLEAGAKPADFPRHELCFACSIETRDNPLAVKEATTVKEIAA